MCFALSYIAPSRFNLLVPARCPHVTHQKRSRNVIMFSTLKVLGFYPTIERRHHLNGMDGITGGQNVENGRPRHELLQEPFNITDHFRRTNHHFNSAFDIHVSSKSMRKMVAILSWTRYSCRTNQVFNIIGEVCRISVHLTKTYEKSFNQVLASIYVHI